MNRRSNTEKVEKYTLVKFDVDGGIGVCATNQIKAEGKIVIGACCEAPFKNKYYSAVVLNMDDEQDCLYVESDEEGDSETDAELEITLLPDAITQDLVVSTKKNSTRATELEATPSEPRKSCISPEYPTVLADDPIQRYKNSLLLKQKSFQSPDNNNNMTILNKILNKITEMENKMDKNTKKMENLQKSIEKHQQQQQQHQQLQQQQQKEMEKQLFLILQHQQQQPLEIFHNQQPDPLELQIIDYQNQNEQQQQKHHHHEQQHDQQEQQHRHEQQPNDHEQHQQEQQNRHEQQLNDQEQRQHQQEEQQQHRLEQQPTDLERQQQPDEQEVPTFNLDFSSNLINDSSDAPIFNSSPNNLFSQQPSSSNIQLPFLCNTPKIPQPPSTPEDLIKIISKHALHLIITSFPHDNILNSTLTGKRSRDQLDPAIIKMIEQQTIAGLGIKERHWNDSWKSLQKRLLDYRRSIKRKLIKTKQ